MGGAAPSDNNTIDYITTASTGNATDFGDLTAGFSGNRGVSNSVRGVSMGGTSGSLSNVIQYITIASTGNASDFGDLIEAVRGGGVGSNGHGGLVGG